MDTAVKFIGVTFKVFDGLVSTVDVFVNSLGDGFLEIWVLFEDAKLLFVTVFEIINFLLFSKVDDGVDLFPVFNLFSYHSCAIITIFMILFIILVTFLICTTLFKDHSDFEIWVFILVVFVNAVWVYSIFI